MICKKTDIFFGPQPAKSIASMRIMRAPHLDGKNGRQTLRLRAACSDVGFPNKRVRANEGTEDRMLLDLHHHHHPPPPPPHHHHHHHHLKTLEKRVDLYNDSTYTTIFTYVVPLSCSSHAVDLAKDEGPLFSGI